MMDKKYIEKVIALPKTVHERLEKVRVRLSEKVGFQMSLSQTIGYLLVGEEVRYESEKENRLQE